MLMLDSIQQRVLNVSMRFWLNELTAIFMYVPTPPSRSTTLLAKNKTSTNKQTNKKDKGKELDSNTPMKHS